MESEDEKKIKTTSVSLRKFQQEAISKNSLKLAKI